jgi:hypothetical protein
MSTEQLVNQLQQQILQQQQIMTQQQQQIENITKFIKTEQEQKNQSQPTLIQTATPKHLTPSKPDTFSGHRRTPADVWLFGLEQYFTAASGTSLTDEFKINFTAAQFREAAATWWRRQQQQQQQTNIGIQEPTTTNSTTTTSWKIFKENFLKQFLPVATKDSARATLHNLKQRNNVSGYCDEFNNTLIRLDNNDMSEADQLFLFKKGLNREMSQMILLLQPKTLSEAMAMAVRLEAENPHRSTNNTQRYGHNHYYNKQSHPPTAHTTSTPMELGRIQDNNEDESNGDSEQSLNALNRRLTPSEVEEYKKQGKCFACGKFGHLSRNCPSRTKPQAQQQQSKKY